VRGLQLVKVCAETRGATRARAVMALENMVDVRWMRCCVTEDKREGEGSGYIMIKYSMDRERQKEKRRVPHARLIVRPVPKRLNKWRRLVQV
jgi:hypothetical protein